MANKKITLKMIKEKLSDASPVTVNWNGLEIHVKPYLTMEEAIGFHNKVVDVCFGEGEGTFLPELKSIIIAGLIVALYSDFPLPSKAQDVYDVLVRSNIAEYIIPHVCESQLSQILEAIDEEIEYRRNANTALFNKQISNLLSSIEGLGNQAGAIFDGIDSEDVKKVMEAFSSGAFDERKLLEAFSETKE